MKKALLFFVILVGCVAVSILIFADQILLTQVRKHASDFPPMKIEVGSLSSHWLGAFAVELGEVSLSQPGMTARVKEVKVHSTMSAFTLFSNFSAKREIPLSIELVAPKISMAPAAPQQDKKPAPPSSLPKAIPLPAMSPYPVVVDFAVSQGTVIGPIEAIGLDAKATIRANPNGMEATLKSKGSAGAASADSLIPFNIDLKVAGNPHALKFQSFAFKAAGLEGAGSGEVVLDPVSGSFKFGMEAPDLAHLSLRPEDRAALGLTAQPSGAFSLKAEANAASSGDLQLVGVFRLQKAELPLNVPEHTMWSGIAKGQSLEGVATLDALIPFRADLHFPLTAAPKITAEKVSIAMDLTQAKVASKGLLQKPKGVPLSASAALSMRDNSVRLESLILNFHTLALQASGTLPMPFGDFRDGTFGVKISSFDGFPKMLPILSASAEGTGASLNEAKGALSMKGRMSWMSAHPSSSFVSFDEFMASSLKLPLSYTSPTMAAKGVLYGSANLKGTYDRGDFNVAHSNGSFDFSDLDLVMKDKMEKKRGRKLLVAFDAKGSPTRLQISKISVNADGLAATLSGAANFAKNRSAQVNLSSTLKAQLGPLREYLPKNMPAKISDGSLDGALRIAGTWLPEGGLEKSPLDLSGKMAARLGTVTMPEPPKAETTSKPVPPPGAMLPPWPIARNARLDSRIDIAQFNRGALTASNISLAGALNRGNFAANAIVGKVFGGKASLKNLTGSLADPKLAVRGSASAEGLDISQAAGFVDPSYGKIVKGILKADSTFAVPNLWAESILEVASAQGKAEIHNGYLSTASFDGLVNEKLKNIPGVGDKAKVSIGGLNAEIHTQFNYASSVAALQNFVATTPKRDEMRLAGKFGLNFDADMSGEAHLASAPVTGPVREANSDPEGRLVVPVRFHGNLKSPQVDIATNAIQIMVQKTAAHEGEKLKNKAINDAKAKAQGALQDAAGGLLDQFKKKLK